MVESGSNSLLGSFSCGKEKSFLSYITGKTMAAQASPNSFHLSPIVKGRLNGKMIQIAKNPSPFEQAEAHLVETMFYDEWALSGESSVFRP